ncbi:cysteine-rich protein 2-binding protein isoform X1 [Phyllobates terribilis]|uniref:cysteine-rich protein 2-binding protein isoform X1 n=1 Tax=Phyllobates terribilis TaxID=111132 RepID=UPI003CCAC2FC
MDTSAHITPMDDDATRTSASEGLEEGEVEGETLLLVESEDQASIDLSHDQSGDSLNSDVGDDLDPPWMEEMPFYCDKCQKWIPASQLRCDPPSHLKGDNFFKVTCSDCSEDGKEQFERLKLTWQQVVMLAMYNLSLEGSGRQGYFRWKEDICSFIEKHWTFLLGNRKKTSTWWSTVAGCLSVGSPMFFKSGAQEFGEPGWWKLVHNKPPTLKPEGDKCISSSQKIKTPGKSSLDPVITVEGLRKRSRGNSVESAIELKEKRSRTQEAKDIRRAQKEASGFVDHSSCSTPVKFSSSRNRRPDIVLEKGEVVDFSSMSSSDRTPMTSPSPSPSLDFSAPDTPASLSATPSLLSEADLIPDVMPPQALFHDDEEMDADGVIDPGMEYLPSPNISHSAPMCPKTFKSSIHVKQEIESEEEKLDRGEGEVHKGPSADRARDKRRPQPIEKDKNKTPQYHSISLYEEKLLLKRLEACPNAVAVTPEARRLRQKLLVRKAKRERGLPLFDLDQELNATLMLVGGVYGAREGSVSRPVPTGPVYRATSKDLRILDRYQTAVPATKGVRHSAMRFLYRLGAAEDKDADLSIVSPYTARILKPYIRRDYETKPCRLQLLAQIRAYAHRNDPSWEAEPQSPIDYSYVRPGHVPTINSICHEFFWPGIDVSECLQYPDFSVVVLYKKVIIAFGFMVPDVKYNEAYISFLFVHPEWRRAGIATFMIYHLIQTCMGKDVTLHVSANNPAMLLYQKFGFKTEEYVLDFYDKYFPIDSKECKHAFSLRLRR